MNAQSHVLFSVTNKVGWITLNRPEARNALTFEMYERVAELCHRASDSGARALVLRGAGEKAFAAGTDISEFRDFQTAEDALSYEADIDRVLTAIETSPLPTIAALGGACTGGGGAIAACCDIRIAAADLKFGFPIARTLGNCLATSTLARLNALMGAGRVREMIFTSRLIEADEMAQIGFVTEVFASSNELFERAQMLAEQIAGHAPLTLRATKEAQRRLVATGAASDDLIELCYTSADFKEGLEAFLAKRRPNWRGE